MSVKYYPFLSFLPLWRTQPCFSSPVDRCTWHEFPLHTKTWENVSNSNVAAVAAGKGGWWIVSHMFLQPKTSRPLHIHYPFSPLKQTWHDYMCPTDLGFENNSTRDVKAEQTKVSYFLPNWGYGTWSWHICTVRIRFHDVVRQSPCASVVIKICR